MIIPTRKTEKHRYVEIFNIVTMNLNVDKIIGEFFCSQKMEAKKYLVIYMSDFIKFFDSKIWCIK